MKKTLMASAALLTMVASASAADLYTKAPALVAPVNNWTGFYIGANAGYGGGETELGTGASGLGSLKNTSSGFVGGGQIGYNWQAGTLLYGLEADIQGSNVKSTSGLSAVAGPGVGDIGTTTNYFGTVRGRFGVMPWDRSVLYVTGGLAYGQTSTSIFLPLGDNTKIGWTVGAGLEYMIAPNWSVKTEYLYVDLGKDDVNLGALGGLVGVIPAVTLSEQSRMHVVRAGVNYHF